MSKRPKKDHQCFMCGHTHRIMASWSSQGETRYLCHEDSHSCYTKHNFNPPPVQKKESNDK